jgi:hypothetical protein
MGWLQAIGALLKSLSIALGWAKEAHDEQVGIDLQRGRDAEDALTVERKVADVAVQPVDVDKALSPGGDF